MEKRNLANETQGLETQSTLPFYWKSVTNKSVRLQLCILVTSFHLKPVFQSELCEIAKLTQCHFKSRSTRLMATNRMGHHNKSEKVSKKVGHSSKDSTVTVLRPVGSSARWKWVTQETARDSTISIINTATRPGDKGKQNQNLNTSAQQSHPPGQNPTFSFQSKLPQKQKQHLSSSYASSSLQSEWLLVGLCQLLGELHQICAEALHLVPHDLANETWKYLKLSESVSKWPKQTLWIVD